jgi:hypothetical protein
MLRRTEELDSCSLAVDTLTSHSEKNKRGTLQLNKYEGKWVYYIFWIAYGGRSALIFLSNQKQQCMGKRGGISIYSQQCVNSTNVATSVITFSDTHKKSDYQLHHVKNSVSSVQNGK